MNKNISNLKTTEEKKILFSKIEKRVNFLSNKIDYYFEKKISISSKNIKDAFAYNEDLISILEKNNNIINEIQIKSHDIRKSFQTNFSNEFKLNISNKPSNISIIEQTLAHKDEFINSNDKMNALNKRLNFFKNRNKKRKLEMEKSMNYLIENINNNKILDIKSMNEDIELIKSFINTKEIKKSKKLFLVPFIFILISILIIGGLLWII